ncbi:MAG: substrate-binding domain-containing protein [Propionibacteriaceae bacterium]|jgi:phosphate transport system substrate-binding protein|nr:substrate-binding domain-containing protein [Propionibacteriaceae bacterium]
MTVKRRLAFVCTLLLALAGCVAPTTQTTPATSPTGSESPALPIAPTTGTAIPQFAASGLPKIDGSTANIPLCSLLVQRLANLPEAEADAHCEFSTTPSAYSNLIYGAPDGEPDYEPEPDYPSLLLVYQADEDTEAQVKESGVELEYHPIGRDALVFLTNEANPVNGLTTSQLKSIYTGKTVNWRDVGGGNQEIIAYQRPETSGSQALMRKFVMGKAKFGKGPQTLVSGSMNALTEGVASYSNTGNALGYSVFYYVTEMLDMAELKLLAVDGVDPTKETIRVGQYPHTNDYYAVIRASEPKGSPARQIVEWLESAGGTQLIAEAGYVGLAR